MGKKFFKNEYNGVVAVISEEDAKLFWITRSAGCDPIERGVRVFTFYTPERLEQQPDDLHVFTGSVQNLKDTIETGNHELLEADSPNNSGWNGYVPFSRLDYPKSDLRYTTSFPDFVKAFGPNLPVPPFPSAMASK